MAFEKQPTPVIETSDKNFIENEINTTIQDTKNKSQELKQEVEQQMPQLSGFMKIVYENNREVYNTMAQKITSTKKPTSDGTIEYYTVEEWSETIEHTRGQITL